MVERQSLSLKIVILSLFLVLFIDGLGISIVLPLFADLFLSPDKGILPIESSADLRNAMYGASLISFSLAMFFGAPILGELSDKFGRKNVLLVSLGGTFLGYLLSGVGVYTSSIELFIFGRLLDGLTAGSIPVAQAAMVDLSTDKNKASNLGLVLFAVTSGYILGPLFSEFLSKTIKQGLASPFVATALLSMISILFLLPMKETALIQNSKKINWLLSLNILALIPKARNALPFIGVFLLFQLAWTMYFQYLPYFLTSTELNNIIAEVLAVVGFGMAAAFCFLTRVFQNKVTPLQGAFISVIVILSSIFTQLSYEKSVPVFLISALLGAMAYGLGYSFLLVQISQKVGNEIQGFIMGITASMSALSATATAVFGFVLMSIGYKTIFLFSCIALLMCALVLYSFAPFSAARKQT